MIPPPLSSARIASSGLAALLTSSDLTVPVIGPPALMSELGRFARTLSVLVSSGLKLQEIMEILPQATSNRVIRDALNQVHDRLILGEGLSEPMSNIAIFPPLLVQMVAVGEESGTASAMFHQLADMYEGELDKSMSRILTLAQPVILIVMGLVIGCVLLAILLPLTDVSVVG